MTHFVSARDVCIQDPGWTRRLDLLQHVVLPYQWRILNDLIPGIKSGCIENFRVVAGQSSAKRFGVVFLDSDVYKWIEAVAYLLAQREDEQLEVWADEAISLIGKAQSPDGYLQTYYQAGALDQRWTNLREGHELYCMGHLIEASVAYHMATGKVQLLGIAERCADCIDRTFGPGKKNGCPGHPEVELALVRLYEATGIQRYLDLASWFIDVRGTSKAALDNDGSFAPIFPEMASFGPEYFLNHKPVREQTRATGHAVRAMYLYCAMADLARLGHDASLKHACQVLYEDVVERQMHVTGGIGTAAFGERFTTDYDLAPDTVYAESCASVGLMFLAKRMWNMTMDARVYDVWERALYNTVLSGMGLDGMHFFYVNPLEVTPAFVHANPGYSHVETQRPKWFGVACCPPNIARCLLSLNGALYARNEGNLWVLSHIGSVFHDGDLRGKLVHEGERYRLTVVGPAADIHLRIPEKSELVIGYDTYKEGSYVDLLHKGGTSTFSYVIKPKVCIIRANYRASALAGKRCAMRGHTVYCAESVDNGGIPLSSLRLSEKCMCSEERPPFPDEDPALSFPCSRVVDNLRELYGDAEKEQTEPALIRLVPYRLWGNRGEQEMRVWFDRG